MTIFIVSLFLPYTIDFKTDSQHEVPRTLTSSVRQPPIVPDSSRLSLLNNNRSTETVHQIEQDPFFTKPGTASTPPTSVTRKGDPRGLARTDSTAPEWGRSLLFNQPIAPSGSAPPSTVLQYAVVEEKAAKKVLDTLRRRSRNPSTPPKILTGTEWTVQHALQGNGGLTNAVRAATEAGLIEEKHFIGTLGFPTDDLEASIQASIEEKLESEFDCVTVYIKDNDFDGHYRNYCKTILWPVFHYQIPDHPKSKAYMDHSWIYYVKVNEAFADKIVSSYKHGDIIWIHDYHLLLVPSLVRKKIADAKIGFFLHTPFPSSEIFRCLPTRKELLNGLLGANIVVFQAEEYAHHFLQTCSHLLLVEADDSGIQLDDRYVNVSYCALGITPEQISLAREDAAVIEWTKILEEKYRGMHLIVATDKLESTRGVRQKLLAYEIFLNQNPELAKKVVMIQVAMSTTGDDLDLDSAVSDVVTRIHARHSTLAHEPIIFLKQDIAFSQYLALLSAADALMITSLRDGMNLACHEYIVCQKGNLPIGKKHGPLVLSEFTGAATVFNTSDIIPVNPWHYAACAEGIKQALEMPVEEKKIRHRNLLRVVESRKAVDWMKDLSSMLNAAYQDHQQRHSMSIPRLSVNVLCDQYKSAGSRLFILDYEGTLATWGSPAKTVLADPQRAVDVVMELLAASEQNAVYVSSGRSPSELEHLFHRIPGLGLIAENGCFIRPFTTEFVSEEWIDLVNSEHTSQWKETIKKVLQYYLERLEGSEVEERHCSLIFKYGDVKDEDAEAASKLAGDCANHLNDGCKELGVRAILLDNKSISIELKHFNKMTACIKVLEHERLRLADRLHEETDSLWLRIESDTSGPATPARGRRSTTSSAPSPVSNSRLQSMSPDGIPIRTGASRRASDRMNAGSPLTHRLKQVDLTGSPKSRRSTTSSDSGYIADESSLIPAPLQIRTGPASGPHFLMLAGDDREDEAVFRWANSLGAKGAVNHVVSVCVGKKITTEAGFTLSQGVTGLLNALGKLAKV